MPLSLIASTALPACSDSGGGSTPTRDLKPDFRIVGTSTQLLAIARLANEDLPSVRLPDEDEIIVNTGSQSRRMEFAVDPINGQYYVTTLSAVPAGAPISFALERGDGDDAPSSVVEMPAPAVLTDPESDILTFVGAQLVVSWTATPGADVVRVVLVPTECTNGQVGSSTGYDMVGDPGTATIVVPASLLPASLPLSGTCAVDVRLERQRNGVLDPAYEPGGIMFARRIDGRRIFVTHPEEQP